MPGTELAPSEASRPAKKSAQSAPIATTMGGCTQDLHSSIDPNGGFSRSLGKSMHNDDLVQWRVNASMHQHQLRVASGGVPVQRIMRPAVTAIILSALACFFSSAALAQWS